MFMTLPSSKMGDSMQEVLATASAGSGRTALPADPPAGLGLATDAVLEPWFSRLPGGSVSCGSSTAKRIRAAPIRTGPATRSTSCSMRSPPWTNGRSVAARRGAARRGAAGIKLHPRAEQFRMSDPAVRRIFALADERRLPIFVHAGRGIPSLGRDALQLAWTYPHAPLILAHAVIADLGWIWREAAGQANLFFDTAWWNTADQLALFALVPPGQIVFASDTPCGRTIAAASVVLRAALTAGLSAEQIWTVAGGQLERLLAGADPLDVGPAPAAPNPRAGTVARAHLHTAGRRGRAPDRRLSRAQGVPRARTARVRAAPPIIPTLRSPPRCVSYSTGTPGIWPPTRHAGARESRASI